MTNRTVDATSSRSQQRLEPVPELCADSTDRNTPTDKELDLQFLTFVEQYASNPIRSEVLQFMGTHPEVSASASEVASQIGRSRRLVRLELYELALGHVVKPIGHNGQICYRLSGDKTIRDLVARFAWALDM